MAGYVCIGALAAFGLLSIGWCLFGWLLHPGGDSIVLLLGEEAALHRLVWLRSLGLLRCRFALLRQTPGPEEAHRLREQGIELWSREDVLSRREMGAEEN